MDTEAFVDKLNEDLELEYQSIVQYVQHIATVKGGEFQSILDELAIRVRQELDHALTLARQIDFLGGIPSTKVPTVPSETDARSALEEDRKLEETQLERYRERTEQAANPAHNLEPRPDSRAGDRASLGLEAVAIPEVQRGTGSEGKSAATAVGSRLLHEVLGAIGNVHRSMPHGHPPMQGKTFAVGDESVCHDQSL